jgi:excisionase family DNA binding protein
MLYNVQDVASYLSISKSMVYKLASKNVLPCVRVCGCIRFRPETVEKLVKENKDNSDNKTMNNTNFINHNFNSQFFRDCV